MRLLICLCNSLKDPFISVFFTFVPIAIMGIPTLVGEPDFSINIVFIRFLSYWQNGEMAFPILAIVGAVLSILSSDLRDLKKIFAMVILLICIAAAFSMGKIIADSYGVKKSLQPSIVTSLWWIYWIMLIIWIIVECISEWKQSNINDILNNDIIHSGEETAAKLLTEKKDRETAAQAEKAI